MRRKLKILRKGLDHPLEKKILTAMITSQKFLAGVKPIYRGEYMLNDYTRSIADWCIKYYKDHENCPENTIFAIFDLEKESMEKAESKVIEKILSDISEEYNEEVDAEYLLNKAREHFKNRATTVLFEQGNKLVSAGRIDKAVELLENRRNSSEGVSNSEDLLSEDTVKTSNVDTTDERLFRFEGKLGSMGGWFERGWLVAFLAPMKRSKTWMLMYTAYCAVEAGLKVLFVSLEMNKPGVLDRFYHMISGASDEGGMITVPTFDCLYNQIGECSKSERIQQLKLLSGDHEEEKKPEYKPTMRYRPCKACREDSPDDYCLETWFERLKTKKYSIRNVLKSVKTLKAQTGGNLRCAVYPSFSATVTDIKAEVDSLIINDYKPDVVIIDYADILAPERHMSERGNIDLIWKNLKRLAGEKNCAVFTASQANRISIERESLRQVNVAEDIRKLAHVDAMFGINQTEQEREEQCIRISELAHRHKREVSHQIKVLQALDIGQPVFDCE